VDGVILAPEGSRGRLARMVLGGDRTPVDSGVQVAEQRENLELQRRSSSIGGGILRRRINEKYGDRGG
jgi:hypothetical protein